ncbi:MAG: lytic transglycosylase domain-containing protein [Oscillospiraceae bacterium]|nr:lytic transglycosylase domain-containing protein [Oscillospiraceae bacterium]
MQRETRKKLMFALRLLLAVSISALISLLSGASGVSAQVPEPLPGFLRRSPGSVYCHSPLSGYKPYNINLPDDLQYHTYKLCRFYNIDMEVALALMWHESRFIKDVPDHVNKNGSHDRGLMQINQINWRWLSERGLNVSNPYDNIECGVLMLSALNDKYGIENALMAYQCGEVRMKELANRGYQTQFVKDIIDLSLYFERSEETNKEIKLPEV